MWDGGWAVKVDRVRACRYAREAGGLESEEERSEIHVGDRTYPRSLERGPAGVGLPVKREMLNEHCTGSKTIQGCLGAVQ